MFRLLKYPINLIICHTNEFDFRYRVEYVAHSLFMVTLLSILCPPCVPVDKLINLLRNIFTVSFALSALVLR